MKPEEVYGIRAEPPQTCPMIDDVIKKLERAGKAMRRYEKCESADELKGMLSEIEDILFSWGGSLEDNLEKIRANVSSIRDWGRDWRDIAAGLKDELDEEKAKQVSA